MFWGDVLLALFIITAVTIVIIVAIALSLSNKRNSSVPRRDTSSAASQPEEQMINEIFHGLQKMEQRIESLETILMSYKKKG